MDDKINALINSAGAIAELTKIHYDAYLKAGFDETQALCLASRLMEIAFLKTMNNAEQEDE